jgi:superfamily I DNA/RNA helicase/RecB family exonuclease
MRTGVSQACDTLTAVSAHVPLESRIDPDHWPEAIADIDGPQLVVAGPGAGKTEFLVRRAIHLIVDRGVSPESVLLLSFSRRGAADLRDRIAAGMPRSSRTVAAATFHSLALRLLESHGFARYGWAETPTLLTKPEQVALVREALAEEDPRRWPRPFRGLLGTASFADEVADFVLRCGERLIGTDELGRRAAVRDDWRALPQFLERYLKILERRRRLDYGTLQARAVDLLDDPGLRGTVAGRFRYVLVDEYQDTTSAQVRLLQLITEPHRNLTVAGDPYQSVYSFRGAELENVAEFPEAFAGTDGAPARRVVLTTSFRVPAEILEAAVRVTAGGRLPGAAGPVTPAAGRGSVETYGFDQHSHEAEWIAAELQRAHLTEGIPYRGMAVLVRSKRRFLPELSRALARRGIPHEKPDRRLVDQPAVRWVLDCVRAATFGGDERTAAVRRLLLGPLVSLPLSAMREAERRRAAGDLSWPQLIRHLVPGGGALAALLEDATWAAELPAARGFWHLWVSLPQLADAASPSRRDERAAWSSLSQVLQRLGERDPNATLADYLAWAQDEGFEATPLLEYHSPDEDRLTLTTLHQAKGLSFEVVVVADAVDGVLPDLRMRESLLGVRHLSRRRDTDARAYARFRLQEEMRLAYTAICRASHRVIWTATATGFDEGGGMPSRFLPLVAGVDTVAEATGPPREHTEPVTPLEAEAWLRRLLSDPTRSAPVRLAALAWLASGHPRLPRRPETFAGIRPRGPDTGLLPDELTLSPSQADAYLECPRLYAVRRRLHIDADGSVYLAFGKLIHAVLEDAEQLALDDHHPHARLEEAIAALETHWDESVFGGPPWSDSWRRRAVRVLRHLYERWPGSGAVARVEHPVDMEIDGILWRGRIDRVEADRERGDVHIVDYKTGTSVPTKEEAARSVQLGFYALAAAEDPEISELGEVSRASFWYPASGAGKRKTVATRDLDLENIDGVTALMAEAAEGIRAEDWTPRPGEHCDRCPVRLVCPVWPEGREAFRW